MKLGKYEIHRPAALSLKAQYTIARRLLRYTMWLMIGVFSLLIVLGIGVYFGTQTEWFHKWSAEQVEKVLDEELEARVEFSAIRFNVFKGIDLDSVRLFTKCDTILQAEKLTVRYDIDPLLLHSIVVSNVTMLSPRIHIKRWSDSSWNVDHIVKPKTDTTTPAPFDWNLVFKKIAIVNGDIVVHDSLSFEPIPNRFHYTKTHLTEVNGIIVARAHILHKTYSASIDELSFKEERTGFDVQSLQTSVQFANNTAEVLRLRLVTPNTTVVVRGTLDSLHKTAQGVRIEDLPISAVVDAPSLHSSDLNLFLPPTFSLSNSFVVASTLRGTLNRLHCGIDKLTTQQTELHGDLDIDYIAGGGPLAYDVRLESSVAKYDDIRRVLPTVVLPQISFLQGAYLDNTRIVGKGDSLLIATNAKTNVGNVAGDVRLRMRKDLEYTGNVTVERVNLASITGNQSLESSFQGTAQIEGKGTTLQTLDSKATVHLTNSSFAGRSAKDLYLRCASTQGGLIRVDSLYVSLPPMIEDSTDPAFDPTEQLLTANGEVDLRDMNHPTYVGSAELSHFPLSRILNASTAPTFIGGSLNVQGSGFHLDSIDGNVHTSIYEFVLKDRALLPFEADVTVKRIDANHRSVTLVSDPADIRMNGKFKIATFGQFIAAQISVADQFVRRKVGVMTGDSLAATAIAAYSLPSDSIAMDFNVNLRNLSPASPFIEGTKLSASAVLHGSVVGTERDMTLRVDTASISKFLVQNGTTFMVSMPLRASAEIRTVDLNSAPNLISGQTTVSADSVFRYDVTRFVYPKLHVDFANNSARFAASTRINKLPIKAIGSLALGADSYIITLDSLAAGITKGLVLTQIGTSQAEVTRRGTSISRLALSKVGSNAVADIHGMIHSNGFEDLQIRVTNFLLQELQEIPQVAAITPLQSLAGSVDTLTVVANQTFTKPHLKINARASNLNYNNVSIGAQTIDALYNGELVMGNAIVTNPTLSKHAKTLEVLVKELPMDISIIPFKAGIRSQENIDIDLVANDVSMAAVAPFIPGVTEVSGIADAKLTIKGSAPDNVNYTGGATIKNSSFLVMGNNLRYTGSGHLSVENDVVTVDSLIVKNDIADLPTGTARVYGTARISGFINIDYVDIYATTPRLQVMSNATQVVNKSIYGPLVIQSGENPLHFYGTLQKPQLRGDVNVLDGYLIFPPSAARTRYASTFVYKRTKRGLDIVEKKVEEQDTTFAIPDDESNVIDKTDDEVKPRLAPSLTDLLYTDLNIRLLDRFHVKMDFSFNEQMVAKVEQTSSQQLRLIRNGNISQKMEGTVNVPNATYKFYKNIPAKGTITFNGEVDNPIVDLVATYSDTRTINNKTEDYIVKIDIDSTKKKPSTVLTYSISGVEATGDPDKIKSDAVMLLLFGKRQEELLGKSASTGSFIEDATSQVTSSSTSALVSKILTDFVQGTPITNVNVDFGGSGSLSDARIQITGELGKGINWGLGGNFGDLTSNNEIRVNLDVGTALELVQLRGVNLQATRTTAPSQAITRQQKEWEVKGGYTFSW